MRIAVEARHICIGVLILSCSVLSAVSTYGQELKGSVKSEHGEPLNGVIVWTYAHSTEKQLLDARLTVKRFETRTDTKGMFKLSSHGALVYFRRDDLRPLTLIVGQTASIIPIIMELRVPSELRIASCRSLTDDSQRVGIGFRFLLTNRFRVKKASQISGFLFGYVVRQHPETMVLWSDATSLEPSEEYFLRSKSFSERAWVSNNTLGYEARGVMTDGRLWRRVSFRGGAVTYEGNSEEAAEAFDRLIQDMCFDETTGSKQN